MRGAVAALGLVLAGWPLAAVAQVAPATAITPDTAPGRGLGTTVSQSGRTFTIDGGARAGANLFHSFAGFDLGAGDTARWARGAGDGGQIANVVNRVTGGTPSHISGVLDSTALPNATFWFVNPAGIVFGAGAQVNVPSAAYFSTAAELRFADGARFAAATPNGSTLSMAAPEAFGFVGGQGTISLSGLETSFAPAAAILSFSASDISVTGSRAITRGLDLIAVGGRTTVLGLADPLAAAGEGRIDIARSQLAVATTDAPGAPLRVGGGEIRLSAGNLTSDTGGGGRAGDVVLQGDRVAVAPSAFVVTSSRGAGAGGDLLVTAGTIDVDALGATTTTGFSSVASADGAAGAIRLTADTINLLGEIDVTDGATAFVGSTITGEGAAGEISLKATRLFIDLAVISSSSLGAGDGGDVRIDAADQQLGAATIVTGAFGGGLPGDVVIRGDTIAISGGTFGAVPGLRQESGELTITATTHIEADGGGFTAVGASPNSFGSITLAAPRIFLSQSTLSTQAFDEGLAGNVLLKADTLLLDRVDVFSDAANGVSGTGLVRLEATGDLVMYQGTYSASAFGTAKGGRIEIVGRDVLLDGAAVVTETSAFGSGDGGQIAITADKLTLTTAAFVSSTSTGDGKSGDISLEAKAISLDVGTIVSSDTLAAGKAGSVSIRAGTLDLTDFSSITSNASRTSSGDAGQVKIEAGRVGLVDSFISSSTRSTGRGGAVEIVADQIDVDSSGGEGAAYIGAESLGFGDAGNISIKAKAISLRNGGSITSASYAEGAAGDVTLAVDDLTLTRGGNVASVGFRTGEGGDISIVAGKILVQSEPGLGSYISSSVFGPGDAGDVNIEVRGALVVDGPGIISSDGLSGEGDAGDLRIKADSITLRDFGGISSSTNDFGDAGTVAIEARALTLESAGSILSASTSKATGDARSVTIAADTISVGQDASISTAAFGRGNAGEVRINATTALRISDRGEVSSSVGVEGITGLPGTGVAGSVTIATKELSIADGGIVSTLSSNANRAGEVNITAGQVTLEGLFASISSSNLSDVGGEAGRISITADGLRVANGAIITTNSTAGAAGDIDILVRRPGLVILEGGEFRGVIATSSGPGTGGKITISDPLAVISNGGRIQALGELSGANVRIQSRYFIRSTDRLNLLEVAGEVKLETGIYDVSSGTVAPDLSVLDASKVLRGQCPAARSTGAVSQLITRPVGPYAREPLTLGPSPAPAIAATTAGACS